LVSVAKRIKADKNGEDAIQSNLVNTSWINPERPAYNLDL